MPVRLVRGDVSTEELSALIAVVAILARQGADDEDVPDQSELPSWGARRIPGLAGLAGTPCPHHPHPRPRGLESVRFPALTVNRPSGPLQPSGCGTFHE